MNHDYQAFIGGPRVFSGRANPPLAQSICDYLQIPLGQSHLFEFSNENIFVQYQENIRQRDVFIVQSLVSPVNRSIMELLIMIDAAKRASAGRITAVLPYYAYGRTESHVELRDGEKKVARRAVSDRDAW